MMLGITRQTLSKELKVLVRDGVLGLGYGRIEMVSMAELEVRGRWLEGFSIEPFHLDRLPALTLRLAERLGLTRGAIN